MKFGAPICTHRNSDKSRVEATGVLERLPDVASGGAGEDQGESPPEGPSDTVVGGVGQEVTTAGQETGLGEDEVDY